MRDQRPFEVTADGWRVMSRDPTTGYEVHALLEELPDGTDRWTIREVVNVEALVAQNAAIRGELDGTRHGDGLSLVARVPLNVFHNRLGDAMKGRDEAFLRRWLNDPDHAAFRVRGGRI